MKNYLLIALFTGISSLAFGQFDIEVPKTQQSLVTKKTADWCPFCGEWGWELYKGIIEDNQAGNALILAAHFSGGLQSDASIAITSNFGGFSQPKFYLNNIDQKANFSNISDVRGAIKSQIEGAASGTPIAQSGIRATYNDEFLLVETNTEFFKEADGAYFISAYLVEKEKIAYQSSVGNAAQHRFLLKSSLSESPFGDQIVDGNIVSGNKISWTSGIALKDAPMLDNLIVATIIWKKEGDNYIYVNSNYTDEFSEIQENTTGIANISALTDYKLYPSVVRNEVSFEIHLEKSFNKAQLAIYNVAGQPVATVHQGPLQPGRNKLVWQPQQVAAGWYAARLILEGKVASLPFIIAN